MEMLNYPDAARLLGVCVGTLYCWVHERRIPHVRLGPRLVRFRRAELDGWIAERQVPVEADAASREERRR